MEAIYFFRLFALYDLLNCWSCTYTNIPLTSHFLVASYHVHQQIPSLSINPVSYPTNTQFSSQDEVFRIYLRFSFDVKGVLDVSEQPGVIELLCSDSRDFCCVSWMVRSVEVQT